ncbi:recombinase family protein [Methylobacterium trifolii]|uniref:Resolvase/invertase-type recombinase catalytic domain-containing protein n=1 Tax=Methylobacterium trifolii TaxID=1003092 RepID=A0ABQ4TWM6_9HYPH|nr:recombinase family protein [Methylobacterium trifolii]GJE59222.1 hypothetical protein MPOCJGCO_1310 [Methylobacterium trifolii]
MADFLADGAWRHVAEVVEVESECHDNRPRLSEAMGLCRLHGATLVIAKLDRLSRDAAFLLNLQKAGVRFVAADMPEANELVVGIIACVAEAKRKMISVRTKVALAAAKARGARFGTPGNLASHDVGQARSQALRTARARDRARDLAPVIDAIRAGGAVSQGKIAAELNARGVPAPRGGAWSPAQVWQALVLIEDVAGASAPS